MKANFTLLLIMMVNITISAQNLMFCGGDPKAVPNNTESRVKAGLVALYEFREGSGDTISDSSGLSPELPLMIQNNDRKEVSWVEGGPGISLRASNYRVNMGNMQAQVVSVSPATKISEAIRVSSAFTAEVWVRPINAEQTGPVRIATISGGAGSRNLSLGQSGVSWDFRARNPAQAPLGRQRNGLPSMRTLPEAFQVQAKIQHVVLTYSASEGGIVYVDGEPRTWELLEGDIVGNAGKWSGELEGWESDFKLMLGNEIGSARNPDSEGRAWSGEIYLLAFYNRALSKAEIAQNLKARY